MPSIYCQMELEVKVPHLAPDDRLAGGRGAGLIARLGWYECPDSGLGLF